MATLRQIYMLKQPWVFDPTGDPKGNKRVWSQRDPMYTPQGLKALLDAEDKAKEQKARYDSILNAIKNGLPPPMFGVPGNENWYNNPYNNGNQKAYIDMMPNNDAQRAFTAVMPNNDNQKAFIPERPYEQNQKAYPASTPSSYTPLRYTSTSAGVPQSSSPAPYVYDNSGNATGLRSGGVVNTNAQSGLPGGIPQKTYLSLPVEQQMQIAGISGADQLAVRQGRKKFDPNTRTLVAESYTPPPSYSLPQKYTPTYSAMNRYPFVSTGYDPTQDGRVKIMDALLKPPTYNIGTGTKQDNDTNAVVPIGADPTDRLNQTLAKIDELSKWYNDGNNSIHTNARFLELMGKLKVQAQKEYSSILERQTSETNRIRNRMIPQSSGYSGSSSGGGYIDNDKIDRALDATIRKIRERFASMGRTGSQEEMTAISEAERMAAIARTGRKNYKNEYLYFEE